MEQIENKQQYDKIDPRCINNTNIPIKKQKLSDYIKKQDTTPCCYKRCPLNINMQIRSKIIEYIYIER